MQPACLRAQVEDPEVGGVVEPEWRRLELVGGPDHPRPLVLDLALAQLVAGYPRAAGDEALGELHLRHLQREEGDRALLLHRHVLGDVGHPGALSHRRAGRDHDQVAGLKAAGDAVDVAEARGRARELGLAGGELLQPVDLVVEDLVDAPEVACLLLVGDLEQQPLGVLGELARLAVAVAHPLLDPLAGAEQPPQQRVLLHDPGVMGGVADSGHVRRQLGDVVAVARLRQLPASLQLLDHRELVGGARLAIEVEEAGEDQPVAVEVEVLGLQLHLVDHRRDGRLGDQHRAQHGPLGFEVLGRDVCGLRLRHLTQ